MGARGESSTEGVAKKITVIVYNKYILDKFVEQLAIPDLSRNDPHVILLLHGFPLSPLQICRTRVQRSLPQIRHSNRRSLRSQPLVLKLRLHIPLRLVHPKAQGPNASRGLLNRRSVQKGMLQIRDNGEYAVYLVGSIAAYGEAKDVRGVTLQLGAGALEATRLVMIQILLTSGVISLNPFNSVYYVAPCCTVFLFVPWVFVEYPLLREASGFHFDFLIFGSNSLCAFALNLAVLLLVGKTSALTMNIARVAKEWFLIVFSWYVIKDMLTPVNLVGHAVVFSGVAYYNYSKLQALKVKDPQNKAGQTDEQSPP